MWAFPAQANNFPDRPIKFPDPRKLNSLFECVGNSLVSRWFVFDFSGDRRSAALLFDEIPCKLPASREFRETGSLVTLSSSGESLRTRPSRLSFRDATFTSESVFLVNRSRKKRVTMVPRLDPITSASRGTLLGYILLFAIIAFVFAIITGIVH